MARRPRDAYTYRLEGSALIFVFLKQFSVVCAGFRIALNSFLVLLFLAPRFWDHRSAHQDTAQEHFIREGTRSSFHLKIPGWARQWWRTEQLMTWSSSSHSGTWGKTDLRSKGGKSKGVQ